MIRASKPRIAGRIGCVATFCLFGAGCAATLPSPEEIPALEQTVQASPEDADALTSLGIAYREAGRTDDARRVLDQAVSLSPNHPGANYYLGLTAEDQGDYTQAAAVYETFLGSSVSSELRDDIAARLARVRRLALVEEVRTSVAQEQALTGDRRTEGTVAVFPFRYSGGNESYRPLSTALAELLAVDLNQVDRLTVLERFRVQTLLDEIALGEAGLVDPASASRGGRLLGAERIVQGEVGTVAENIASTALVVDAETGAAGSEVTSEDAAQRFIEMEKILALGLFESLGVVLTVAERERVQNNRTENLQALLAFGLGLEASDRGDFAEARRQFDAAVALDPGFQAAVQASEEAEQLERAFGVTTAEASLRGVQELAGGLEYAEWMERRYGFREIEALTPWGIERDPVPEVLGEEAIGGAAGLIRIVFPRPGGEQ